MTSKNITILFILLALITANLLFWQSFSFGLIIGLIYLFFYGKKLGDWLFSGQAKDFKIFYGVFFLLSLISLIGAIIYFFYRLNDFAIILTLLLIPLGIYKLTEKGHQETKILEEKETQEKNLTLPYLILVLVYLTIIISLFSFVFSQATTNAIRSPWQLVPAMFFYFYFLASLMLLGIIWQDRERKISLGLIILHCFFSTSIALFSYKLGYGFDSLIHQATEKAIILNGMILPKNFFYLGQYSLVTILSKLFNINFLTIDKLLVPLGFSLFLPPLIYYSLNQALGFEKRVSLLISFLFLAWPFSSFIVTTPQNLANLYILISIFFGLLYIKNKINLTPLLILLATALIIHPLAGIPIVILTLLLFFKRFFITNQKINLKNKKNILGATLFLMSFSLPILFLINYLLQSGFVITFKQLTNLSNIASSLEWLRLYFINQYDFFHDLAYFYKINFYFFIFILTLLSLYLFKNKFKFLASYLLAFVVTFINFLFLRIFIFFAFVISYEQNDYSQRVLDISFYFLAPILICFSYLIVKKIENKNSLSKFIFLLLLSGLLTGSLYLSYPRDDEYQASHAYSISGSDVKAVRYINKVAGSPYIVLANQQVSATAVREFGFKKFYPIKVDQNKTYKQFYYPIPTSSPLYTYYLEMVYDNPSKEIMTEAMETLGVKEAYFVINDYWWRFDKIIAEAKKNANSWQAIDREKIYVFRYLLD